MDPFVCVIDDDEDIREALNDVLTFEGYPVLLASDGAEALERLRGHEDSCRLILLDLMMPVMTGDEFRRRQLADRRYSHVPVICMTAAHDGSDRAARMHAAGYFQKPVDFEALLTAVRSHCH